MIKEVRDKVVRVRFTPSELVKMDEAARLLGLTRAGLLRMVLSTVMLVKVGVPTGGEDVHSRDTDHA